MILGYLVVGFMGVSFLFGLYMFINKTIKLIKKIKTGEDK
jgi:hypothetical protein